MWKEATPTKRKRNKSKTRQEGSRDLGLRNRGEGISEILPVTSTFSKEDYMSSEQTIFSHQIQNAALEDDQVKDAIDPSTLSTTLDDGESLQGSKNIEALLMTLNGDLDEHVLHLTPPVLNSSAVILASECPGPPLDIESHTPSVSNNESEIWNSNFADQLSEIVLFDSNEIDVQSKSRIFMDVDTDLSICFCSDLGVWKFCTRSLLLLDNSEATFVLQNPCETYCEHISIQTESATGLGEQDSPQTLEVSLCNISTDMASSTTLQDQLSLSFTVVSSSRLNYLRTRLFYEKGVMEWVVGRPELFIVADTPHSGIEEDDDETRTVGDEEQNSEQVVANPPDQNRKLGPFSSVPCLFCRQDALSPRWSGGGQAGFLFGSNKSLRMICERCKDSTWISAMTWGPSFPGGEWHIGS